MPAATRDFNPSASIVIALKGTGSRAGEHRPVQAEVYGQWAVHRALNATACGGYTVSHVPSGCAALTGRTLESARWLAELLHARVPAFDATKTPEWNKAAPIIRKLVLRCP